MRSRELARARSRCVWPSSGASRCAARERVGDQIGVGRDVLGGLGDRQLDAVAVGDRARAAPAPLRRSAAGRWRPCAASPPRSDAEVDRAPGRERPAARRTARRSPRCGCWTTATAYPAPFDWVPPARRRRPGASARARLRRRRCAAAPRSPAALAVAAPPAARSRCAGAVRAGGGRRGRAVAASRRCAGAAASPAGRVRRPLLRRRRRGAARRVRRGRGGRCRRLARRDALSAAARARSSVRGPTREEAQRAQRARAPSPGAPPGTRRVRRRPVRSFRC